MVAANNSKIKPQSLITTNQIDRASTAMPPCRVHALGFLTLLLMSASSSFRIPQWRPSSSSRAQCHLTMTTTTTTFDALLRPPNALPEWLLGRCVELGYGAPTLVQEAALPAVFDGEDVVLQAQTGSGKTLVYALPVLSKIDPTRAAIQAVIVVPSRELGLQVSGVLKQLASGSPEKIMVMSLVEGSKNRRQQLWAVSEPPHIVVGNPKSLQRIVDLGRLRLNAVSFVVVDEVDACLISPETRQELHTLLSRRLSATYQTADDADGAAANEMKEDLVYTNLAKDRRDVAAAQTRYRHSRQTILCSATIPQRQHFASMCEKEGWTETLPRLIHVTPEELVPRQVRHEHVEVPEAQRVACFKFLLQKEMRSWGAEEEEEVENGAGAAVPVAVAAAVVDAVRPRRVGGGLLRGRLSGGDKAPAAAPTVPAASSPAHTATTRSSSSSGSSGAGRPKFQVVVFVEDEALASDVCAAARAALAASGSGAVGTVSYLSDAGSLDERAQALGAFRDGKATVLVCSDIAARGLDVPDVSHVFQMRLPDNVDEYVHKAGRAGRLGRRGKAITFTAPEEAFVVQRFSNEVGVPIHRRAIKSVKKQGGTDAAAA